MSFLFQPKLRGAVLADPSANTLSIYPQRTGLPRVLAIADHYRQTNGRKHGGTTYFETAYPALCAAGVPLTALFFRGQHDSADALREQGVDTLFLNRSKTDPGALLDVWRWARMLDAQVLHLHSYQSHALGRVVRALRNRQGCRSLLHIHDTVPLRGVNRWVQRRLAPCTDAAIVVSDACRAMATDAYGVRADRVFRVYYGLDAHQLRSGGNDARARLRAEWGVSPGQPLLGVVARFDRMKGHRYAIEAMRRIAAGHPDAAMVLVGQGALEPSIRRQASEAGLGPDRVIFAGQRDDIPAVMQALDLLVIPSEFGESFGLVAVEAMANGRPVVAFDVPGPSEVVVHQNAGLIVRRDDPAALADAALKLLSDRDLYQRLAAAAPRRAAEFNMPRHVQAMLQVYRWLHRSGPRPEIL